MTSEGDTNSDQIADTSQAGRSRRPGWGVGLLASGALIAAPRRQATGKGLLRHSSEQTSVLGHPFGCARRQE
jgi:hypothetical protein